MHARPTLHACYTCNYARLLCVRSCDSGRSVWVCVRGDIDGALSLFQHGDKRSLTARERGWQPLYQSRWLITACVSVRVCVCKLRGKKMISKINQSHAPCQQLLSFSGLPPPAVTFKVQWPHEKSRLIKTLTRMIHWHTQANRCQCVSHIFKRLGQDPEGHGWPNVILAPKSSSFSIPCFWLFTISPLLCSFIGLSQWGLTIFSPFSFHDFLSIPFPILSPFSRHLFTLVPCLRTSSNPEPQWAWKLMQRIHEELGIQLEKIGLLSFQPDI